MNAAELKRLMVVSLALAFAALSGCGKKPVRLDPDVLRFANEKEAQAKTIVAQQSLTMPSEGVEIFEAIRADDFVTASNQFARLELIAAGTPQRTMTQAAVEGVKAQLRKHGFGVSETDAVRSAAWHSLLDAYWAYAVSKSGGEKHLQWYAEEIFSVIPANSIFIAGSDPARFTISAKSVSHAPGQPLFIISENQLVDERYVEYLTLMYSNRLRFLPSVPSVAGLQSAAFSSTNSLAALRRINGELLGNLFTNNPGNEFFIRSGWHAAEKWLYPLLLPHGPVLKINREPLSRLPEEMLAADRRYWARLCGRLIGDWITETTTSREVCDFIERVYVKKQLEGFRGDPAYLTNHYMQKEFSQMRYAEADLYLRRFAMGTEMPELRRMQKEANLAFMQALALGPEQAHIAFYFGWMLSGLGRNAEAERVLRLGLIFNPTDAGLSVKLKEVEARAQSSALEKN